jgi:hypothetical protein
MRRLREKLRKEELNKLYASSNIIRTMKPRRMRWVGHLACMGKREKQDFGGKRRKKETTRKS